MMLKFENTHVEKQPCLWTINELVASFKPGTTFTCIEGNTPNLYIIVSGGDGFNKEILCLSLGRGELFINHRDVWRWNNGTIKMSADKVFKLVDAKVEIL